ncbi:MAG: ABC transporter ATP-binding protein [Bdellovibrionota bacterium]
MKIRIENLSKNFKDAHRTLTVLGELSFEFPEAKSVAILGRSGIGKSTFLHLLGGLESPSAGSVFYGNTDLTKLKDDELSSFRGNHVGFVFQFHHLLPEFDAVENVMMPLIISGVSENKAREKAENILVKVGLAERLTHRPGELSGGEQQRVAIARAVVTEPSVILADEPTGSLDQSTANEVLDLLFSINKRLQNLLVIVTHNRELAERMDLVLEMQAGGSLIKAKGV